MKMTGRVVSIEGIDRMIDQVLGEIDGNVAAYSIFAKRWTEQLKPLLEFKEYLLRRAQMEKRERLNEEIVSNKEVSDRNSKNPTKNKAKTGRKTV